MVENTRTTTVLLDAASLRLLCLRVARTTAILQVELRLEGRAHHNCQQEQAPAICPQGQIADRNGLGMGTMAVGKSKLPRSVPRTDYRPEWLGWVHQGYRQEQAHAICPPLQTDYRQERLRFAAAPGRVGVEIDLDLLINIDRTLSGLQPTAWKRWQQDCLVP